MRKLLSRNKREQFSQKGVLFVSFLKRWCRFECVSRMMEVFEEKIKFLAKWEEVVLHQKNDIS